MGLACLQPTPRYCNESGQACRFPCHGNASVCKVLKCSSWEMNPPKDLWHTGFACWLESRRPRATCADVTLYGGQFTLSTQLIILKYPVMLSHWHSTKVFVENYLLYSSAPLRDCRQVRTVEFGRFIALSSVNIFALLRSGTWHVLPIPFPWYGKIA